MHRETQICWKRYPRPFREWNRGREGAFQQRLFQDIAQCAFGTFFRLTILTMWASSFLLKLWYPIDNNALQIQMFADTSFLYTWIRKSYQDAAISENIKPPRNNRILFLFHTSHPTLFHKQHPRKSHQQEYTISPFPISFNLPNISNQVRRMISTFLICLRSIKNTTS